MPKVSIIIPVYNAEKYLERCLSRVCYQTLADIEIICVNDCSRDNSRSIIEKFSTTDSRVKLIENEENIGAAFSRNKGIEAATGTYIGFVDNDDCIEPDMYELLYRQAAAEQTDIVRCNVCVHNGSEETRAVFPQNLTQEERKHKILSCLIGLKKSDNAYGLGTGAVWNKIYKTDMIRNHHIRFFSEREFPTEDCIFNVLATLNAQKIAVIDEALYHHYEYSSSLGFSSYSYNNFARNMDTLALLRKILNQHSPLLLKEYEERFAYRICSFLLPSIINEWKRNPNGKIVALKHIFTILKLRSVNEAIRQVDWKEVAVPLKNKRLLFFVNHIIKLFNFLR